MHSVVYTQLCHYIHMCIHPRESLTHTTVYMMSTHLAEEPGFGARGWTLWPVFPEPLDLFTSVPWLEVLGWCLEEWRGLQR